MNGCKWKETPVQNYYIKNQPFYLVGTDEYDNERKSKTVATFKNFIRSY